MSFNALCLSRMNKLMIPRWSGLECISRWRIGLKAWLSEVIIERIHRSMSFIFVLIISLQESERPLEAFSLGLCRRVVLCSSTHRYLMDILGLSIRGRWYFRGSWRCWKERNTLNY